MSTIKKIIDEQFSQGMIDIIPIDNFTADLCRDLGILSADIFNTHPNGRAFHMHCQENRSKLLLFASQFRPMIFWLNTLKGQIMDGQEIFHKDLKFCIIDDIDKIIGYFNSHTDNTHIFNLLMCIPFSKDQLHAIGVMIYAFYKKIISTEISLLKEYLNYSVPKEELLQTYYNSFFTKDWAVQYKFDAILKKKYKIIEDASGISMFKTACIFRLIA